METSQGGMDAAMRHMKDAYSWAGAEPERVQSVFAEGKGHVFDQDYQDFAWDWFDRYLKNKQDNRSA